MLAWRETGVDVSRICHQSAGGSQGSEEERLRSCPAVAGGLWSGSEDLQDMQQVGIGIIGIQGCARYKGKWHAPKFILAHISKVKAAVYIYLRAQPLVAIAPVDVA